MSGVPAEKPETPGERVERLRRELAEAEAERDRGALADQISDLAGFFLGLTPFDDTDPWLPNEHMAVAVEVLRVAKAKYDHRVALLAATPSKPPPRQLPAVGEKRPAGSGSIQQSGKSFQWRLSREGKVLKSKLWPTREEAEAELARVIADPAFVPAPKDRTRLTPTKRHACSRCGTEGHRAPACPERDAPAPPSPPAKRPPGAGSVYRTDANGWRWSIRRAGMDALQGRTFPTEAEALADLDRVVADRAAGTAPPDLISLAPATTVGPPVKGNACTVCGESGHNARRHRSEAKSEAAAPAPVSSATTAVPSGEPEQARNSAGPAARRAEEEAERDLRMFLQSAPRMSVRDEIDEDENPAAAAQRRARDQRRIEEAHAVPAEPAEDLPEAPEDEADGWGPPDADGRQTCVPCNGEGVDNRPGDGAGRCCLNCDGEGYRWLERAAASGVGT